MNDQMNQDIVKIINYKNNNKDKIDNILLLKKEFLKRYSSYYSQPKIKSKLLFYANNIGKETKKHKIKAEQIRLHKLKKVITIYKSDLCLYNKLDKISKVFSGYKELWENYYDLVVPFIETNFIKDLNNIYLFLKKYSKELSFISYYSNQEKKYMNLEYAEFIINLYLDNDVLNKLDEFLYNLGIDKKSFDYCIDTVCEFNYVLYSQFVSKKEKNDIVEQEYNIRMIEDFIYALNNGKYPDGIEFDMVEFFKRIPFKYYKNFSNELLKFVKNNISESEEIITQFLKEKKLNKRDINKEIDFDALINSHFYINNSFVTRDDINLVLTYMQDNNLPMFNIIFFELLNKYKNDMLQLSEIKKIKKKIILIP